MNFAESQLLSHLFRGWGQAVITRGTHFAQSCSHIFLHFVTNLLHNLQWLLATLGVRPECLAPVFKPLSYVVWTCFSRHPPVGEPPALSTRGSSLPHHARSLLSSGRCSQGPWCADAFSMSARPVVTCSTCTTQRPAETLASHFASCIKLRIRKGDIRGHRQSMASRRQSSITCQGQRGPGTQEAHNWLGL